MLEEKQHFYDIPTLGPELRRLLIYSKMMALEILDIYGENGYPRKYLISDLGLPEGALKSNIAYLYKNGYIDLKKEIIEGKEEGEVCRITDKGRKALIEIIDWIKKLEKYREGGKSGN
jgi:predicted transcriptional regulator